MLRAQILARRRKLAFSARCKCPRSVDKGENGLCDRLEARKRAAACHAADPGHALEVLLHGSLRELSRMPTSSDEKLRTLTPKAKAKLARCAEERTTLRSSSQVRASAPRRAGRAARSSEGVQSELPSDS